MPRPGNPQSLNRYSYVDNNPLRYTDPSGRWAFEEDPYTPGRLYPPTAYAPAHRKVGYDFYSDKEVSAGEMVKVATLPFQAAAATVAFEGVIADVEVLGEVATTAWEKIAGTIASYLCLSGNCEDEARTVGQAADALCTDGNRTSEIDTGSNVVYQYIEDGVPRYVGITNDFWRRAAEHLRSREWTIEPIQGLEHLSRFDARAVEQVLIEHYGLENLYNRINSIAASNPIYQDSVQRGTELLKRIGFLR